MTLLYAAVAYLVGIGLAAWWSQRAVPGCPLPPWLWLLPLSMLPAAGLLDRIQRPKLPPMRWPPAAGFEPPGQRVKPSVGAAVALCLAAGMLRYAGQPFTRCWTPADLAYANLPAGQAFDRAAQQVAITGAIDSYPLAVDGIQDFVLAAHSIQVAGSGRAGSAQKVQGRVRVTARSNLPLAYGQQVIVTGRLSEPAVFEDFSYKDYLAAKDVYSVLYNGQVQIHSAKPAGNPLVAGLYRLRRQGEALIDRSLAEPYAALANGMLLGIEANIPDELYEQFNGTGTSHVIVISGTNVALVSGVIVAVAGRLLGKRRALWPALAAIAGYALLVGGDASVVRAAVMGGLFVTASAINRRSTALVSLAAAAMAMTLANPLALWDAGLQLSSLATAGLIVLAPTFARSLRRLLGQSPSFLRITGEDVLAVTLAASIATLPLSLYRFGRLPLVSLPANLLIVPVQPLILFGGSTALVTGIAGLEQAAQVLFWLPWLGLAWTVSVVRWFAGLPLAGVYLAFGAWQMGTAYVILAIACGWGALRARWGQHTEQAGRASGSWLARLAVAPATLVVAGAAAVLIWMAVLARPDGRLHVWFLDVGQGDGILIQTPSGSQVLIDGGSSAQALLAELGAVMPFWDRDLDLVVLTHPDGDHMAAQVDADGRFRIGAAWQTPESAADSNSAAWQTAVTAAGAKVQLQSAGGWADLGDGVALWVLSPQAQGFGGEGASNQNSLVARLVYGGFSVLLTGDAGTAAEGALLAGGAPLASTVLKVAHHGSNTSTGAAFLAAVDPALAVIQVGENRYGHPNADLLDRLAGRSVLRTDLQGRIEVISDGRQVWVETEKP